MFAPKIVTPTAGSSHGKAKLSRARRARGLVHDAFEPGPAVGNQAMLRQIGHRPSGRPENGSATGLSPKTVSAGDPALGLIAGEVRAAGGPQWLPQLAGGTALDPATRTRLEPRFGFDFSHIRIHADEAAARSAANAGALAYTVGSHIIFGRGRYDPASREGALLLAHELAHAVQQGGVSRELAFPWHTLRSSTPLEEREAERGASLALAGQPAGIIPGREPALARADAPHTTKDLDHVVDKFRTKNDHLTSAQVQKVIDSVKKTASTANTPEVAYAFFDYYSGYLGFGYKIVLMTPTEEQVARTQDRVAETKPSDDTKLRSDALGFTDEALGALLLHKLSHTGQSTSFTGTGDYQEGQSYAIEYFYAEQSRDAARMSKIVGVISAGAIVLSQQRPSLRELFKIAYSVMMVLQKLSVTGSDPKLPITGLGAADGQVLLAEYVTNFAHPSDRLQKIIDYVKANLASYATPSLP
jgi:hypothetical protein